MRRRRQSATAAACAALAALILLASQPRFSAAQPACAVSGLYLNVRHYATDLTSVGHLLWVQSEEQ